MMRSSTIKLILLYVWYFTSQISTALVQSIPRRPYLYHSTCSYHQHQRLHRPTSRLACIQSITQDDIGRKDKHEKTLTKEVGIYLISFPDLYSYNNSEDEGKQLSKTSKRLKKWKEYCLGDGGVYFDQRPKALKALNALLSMEVMDELQKQLSIDVDSDSHELKVETAVLSTCARFEILVAVESFSDKKNHPMVVGDIVQKSVVNSLATQITFRRRRISYLLQNLLPLSLFDLPSRIRTTILSPPKSTKAKVFLHEFNASLMHEIMFTEGVHFVSERLCLIAAGLQDRQIFRPFSARDSHVMQQVKRTSDGATRYSTDKTESSPTYCKLLFDGALQSGKAARSPKAVPILDELREASSGADGPPELSMKAAESAKLRAVNPAVKACVSKFKAMEATDDIMNLRERAKSIVEEFNLKFDDDECKSVRSVLHRPTMKLREGIRVDIDQVLVEIQLEVSNIVERRTS